MQKPEGMKTNVGRNYFYTGKTPDKYKRTDLQMITAGFGWNIDYGLGLVKHWWGHKEGFYESIYLNENYLEQYDIEQPSLVLLRPKSRGTLRLRQAFFAFKRYFLSIFIIG